MTAIQMNAEILEFFARVDEAREQIKRGEGVEMLPNESLDEFLQRVG